MSTTSKQTFYYLNAEKQSVGPMALHAILRLADAGIVDSETLLCRTDEEEWKPLKVWGEYAPMAIGPPLTAPPPRSKTKKSKVEISRYDADLPAWTAPAAVGTGIVSLMATVVPLLALLLAIPAIAGGILILRQHPSQQKGLALTALISGSLGALPALFFVFGMFFGTFTPDGRFTLFGPSIEDQVVGDWIAGTEIQFGEAQMGYGVRAEFEANGSCTIIWGMEFGAARPGDPRGTDFVTKASGNWELVNGGKNVIAKIGESPEFEMRGNNGERSFTAKGGPYESPDGDAEKWEFEIRSQGQEVELFCYPPGFNRGYTFIRAE